MKPLKVYTVYELVSMILEKLNHERKERADQKKTEDAGKRKTL